MPWHPRAGRTANPERRTAPSGLIAALAAGAVLAFLAIAPATVEIAHAASSLDSTATLLWTAPGDDGSTGVAAQYDLRYRATPIVGSDTLAWWNAATPVTNMPVPRPAGVTDSVQVRGLTPSQTYYFILRTADEVPNWSNFSNVAIRLPYSDVIAPAAIVDLAMLEQGASPFLPGLQSPAPAGASEPTRRD